MRDVPSIQDKMLAVPRQVFRTTGRYDRGCGTLTSATCGEGLSSSGMGSIGRSSDRRAYCLEALEKVTVIAGVVSAAAITGSLLFLARQTSQSVHQFLVANELAGGRALAQGYELWDRVITCFIDHPELRQYFYEGVELPEDSTARARVLAMTELIGDAL